MTFHRVAYIFVISLIPTSVALAQEVSFNPTFGAAPAAQNYTLGWSTVDKGVNKAIAAPPAPVSRPVAPQPTINLNAPDPGVGGPPRATASGGRRINGRPTIPVYNIEFNTHHFYDVYAQRYLKVRAVEVQTYRRGYNHTDVFENTGEYARYDVFLNDLRPGDRYTVTVIWENGANRTVAATMGSQAQTRVFIDQPDALAYYAW